MLDGSPSAEAEATDEVEPAAADGHAAGPLSSVTGRPYQTLFMEAPEAYVVTNAAGTVIDLNRYAERLQGLVDEMRTEIVSGEH